MGIWMLKNYVVFYLFIQIQNQLFIMGLLGIWEILSYCILHAEIGVHCFLDFSAGLEEQRERAGEKSWGIIVFGGAWWAQYSNRLQLSCQIHQTKIKTAISPQSQPLHSTNPKMSEAGTKVASPKIDQFKTPIFFRCSIILQGDISHIPQQTKVSNNHPFSAPLSIFFPTFFLICHSGCRRGALLSEFFRWGCMWAMAVGLRIWLTEFNSNSKLMIFLQFQISMANKISKFLRKLFQILDTPQYQDIISWDDQGKKVMIKDQLGLQHSIIPTHFSLKKFSSFVRQLHLYNFHKLKSGDDMLVFTNPQFLRHNRDLAGQVVRKRKPKTQDKQRDESCKVEQVPHADPPPSKEKFPLRTSSIFNDEQKTDYPEVTMKSLTKVQWKQDSFDIMSLLNLV